MMVRATSVAVAGNRAHTRARMSKPELEKMTLELYLERVVLDLYPYYGYSMESRALYKQRGILFRVHSKCHLLRTF